MAYTDAESPDLLWLNENSYLTMRNVLQENWQTPHWRDGGDDWESVILQRLDGHQADMGGDWRSLDGNDKAEYLLAALRDSQPWLFGELENAGYTLHGYGNPVSDAQQVAAAQPEMSAETEYSQPAAEYSPQPFSDSPQSAEETYLAGTPEKEQEDEEEEEEEVILEVKFF